jgi:hypothetical protein
LRFFNFSFFGVAVSFWNFLRVFLNHNLSFSEAKRSEDPLFFPLRRLNRG